MVPVHHLNNLPFLFHASKEPPYVHSLLLVSYSDGYLDIDRIWNLYRNILVALTIST